MSRELRVGAESFWEMVALSMSGRLASCTSCVEHFYFQSETNSYRFLEACAAAGLLQRLSLLDLFGDLGARSVGGRRSRYDEPIYLSAPEFRRAHPDEARRRMEGTKRAVHTALRLYYEELGANKDAVSAAYQEAVQQGRLRHSATAKERIHAELSAVAKLRLIQDGFRFTLRAELKKQGTEVDNRIVEKRVADETVRYIRTFFGAAPELNAGSELKDEMDRFILGFLADEYTLEDFWNPSFGDPPVNYRSRVLPVILNLARERYRDLLSTGDASGASSFAEVFAGALHGARQRAGDDRSSATLDSLIEEWEAFVASAQLTMAAGSPESAHSARSLSVARA